MRVSISIFGRFHAFYLAHELHRRDALECLITSYPSYEVVKYGIPRNRVESILWPELARRAYFKLPNAFKSNDLPLAVLADRFDAAASNRIRPGLALCVGWSSFCERTLLRARSLGARTVVERGSSHIEYQRDILREEYERFGKKPHLPHPRVVAKELREYSLADAISVPSNFVKQTFLDKGFPSNRIVTIPYGVDLSGFPQRPDSDHVFRVIFVGGMSLRKGVHYLLEAWSSLRLPNAELWLVGGRNPEIEPFFDRYKGTYQYFPPVPQSELHTFYAQSSVFALCSIEEGLALVLPQAMSSGLPILCTTNTGGADLVEDGVEGYVIPIRDVEAIKEKLLYLYENPEVARHMGMQARKKVEQGFTWSDYGDRVMQAYQSILDSRGVGTPRESVTNVTAAQAERSIDKSVDGS